MSARRQTGADVGREPFAAAMAALAACADAAAAAGHSLAATYVAGASGNLRHALACLELRATDDHDFDIRRVGVSELIGTGAMVDTIRNCRLPDGRLGTVRALVPGEVPERGVWLRSDAALRHLVVRGSVGAGGGGMIFEDGAPEGSLLAGARDAPAPDLALDLLRGSVPDLCADRTEAAAWEVSLAAGSWVHLATGRRWFADRATAKAVVRMLGGVPGMSDRQASRIGAVVDRDVVLAIEAFGWRHWPTPVLD